MDVRCVAHDGEKLVLFHWMRFRAASGGAAVWDCAEAGARGGHLPIPTCTVRPPIEASHIAIPGVRSLSGYWQRRLTGLVKAADIELFAKQVATDVLTPLMHTRIQNEPQAWMVQSWPRRVNWLTSATLGPHPTVIDVGMVLAVGQPPAEFYVRDADERIANIGVPLPLAKGALAAGFSLQRMCASVGVQPPLLREESDPWACGYAVGDSLLMSWLRTRAHGEVANRLGLRLARAHPDVLTIDWAASEVMAVCVATCSRKSWLRDEVVGLDIDELRGLNPVSVIGCRGDKAALQRQLVHKAAQRVRHSPLIWGSCEPHLMRTMLRMTFACVVIAVLEPGDNVRRERLARRRDELGSSTAVVDRQLAAAAEADN